MPERKANLDDEGDKRRDGARCHRSGAQWALVRRALAAVLSGGRGPGLSRRRHFLFSNARFIFSCPAVDTPPRRARARRRAMRPENRHEMTRIRGGPGGVEFLMQEPASVAAPRVFFDPISMFSSVCGSICTGLFCRSLPAGAPSLSDVHRVHDSAHDYRTRFATFLHGFCFPEPRKVALFPVLYVHKPFSLCERV